MRTKTLNNRHVYGPCPSYTDTTWGPQNFTLNFNINNLFFISLLRVYFVCVPFIFLNVFGNVDSQIFLDV